METQNFRILQIKDHLNCEIKHSYTIIIGDALMSRHQLHDDNAQTVHVSDLNDILPECRYSGEQYPLHKVAHIALLDEEKCRE